MASSDYYWLYLFVHSFVVKIAFRNRLFQSRQSTMNTKDEEKSRVSKNYLLIC